MSEINQKSVALAKNIHKKDPEAVIVFTDVFEKNEEKNFELLTQVRDIKAICLKRDITHLNILSKKGNVEIFLIGEDEAENVSQAVKLTTHLNNENTKHNIKIFVFSNKESSAHILDSVQYNNLLKQASETGYGDESFKLRRVNVIKELAWDTISNMKIFETAQKNNHTISVLIAGMGSYGMEFFKTLLWFCQFDGFKLNITVVDKLTDGDDGKKSIESVINHQCPELLKHNMSDEDGEARYSVKILSGVDFSTSAFEEMVLYSGDDAEKLKIAQRIKETDIAIVTLGDDDLNIETAVRIRSIFDRLHGIKAKENISLDDERVQIYSVVYDEQKSGILHGNDSTNEAEYLVNHSDVPYHIHFIGGMSSQFNYKNVYDAEFEKEAYKHHLGWVDVQYKIHQEQNEVDKAEKLEKEYQDPQKLIEEMNKYEKHEYYRQSSMAKELHQQSVRKIFGPLVECLNKQPDKEMQQTCECENCVRRKKSEHMRWNAYTRTIGYSYQDGIRADRAKLHNNLVGWERLSKEDKWKD